jgi:hypothetical protein
MPVFLAALIGGLVSAVGSVIGRAMVTLGIGIVAYSGIDLALSSAKAFAIAKIGAMGSVVVGLAGVFQIGAAINIIFSAMLMRIVMLGVTSGVYKRFVLK